MALFLEGVAGVLGLASSVKLDSDALLFVLLLGSNFILALDVLWLILGLNFMFVLDLLLLCRGISSVSSLINATSFLRLLLFVLLLGLKFAFVLDLLLLCRGIAPLSSFPAFNPARFLLESFLTRFLPEGCLAMEELRPRALRATD